MATSKSARDANLVLSYLSMRRMVGLLGIALPFIVILGSYSHGKIVILGSISAYYYTNVRDFFVGLLCGVSLFLISYDGYERIDSVITKLSGFFALGIVAFPTSMFSGRVIRVGIFRTPDDISQYLHLGFSILFLTLLAFNSIFLFTRHGGSPSREKRIRNVIYVVSGFVMLWSVIFMIIYIAFLTQTFITDLHPILLLESIALISFGVSWLVKGSTLFKDKKTRPAPPSNHNHRLADAQVSDG